MMKLLLIGCAVAVLVGAQQCPDEKATQLRAMLCSPPNTPSVCGTEEEIVDLVDAMCLNTTEFKKQVEETGNFPPLMQCQMKEASVNASHVDTEMMKSCVKATQSTPLMNSLDSLLGGSEGTVTGTVGLIDQIVGNSLGGQ